MEKKTTINTKESPASTGMFSKENYMWMAAGIVIMAIGLLLMAGGKSNDPNVFNKDEVYNFKRITIAPILILAGFVIEIYAIFKNPKNNSIAE
jgi:FtsH-binding integral membrane protein